jgi:hypothetical protein
VRQKVIGDNGTAMSISPDGLCLDGVLLNSSANPFFEGDLILPTLKDLTSN